MNRKIVLAAALLGLAACSREGKLDVVGGVGVNVNRTGCPTVGVVEGTGDITTFNPVTSRDADAIDVVATITNVKSNCTVGTEKHYADATFDVLARRSDTRGERQVTLPYYSVVMQGGSSVVSKRVGQIVLNFADGADRASASGRVGAYVDAASTRLPADVQEKITRKRKPGDEDAALDPLADPQVRSALSRATFELLVGFQLTEEQLRYNVTR